MILADKIINERKKNGWSQEDLAEKLSVSRQSVSKWEGAQATPDLQKLIKMAELFGVSTDYLLKDELEPEDITTGQMKEEAISEPPARKVSLAEANDYLAAKKQTAPHIANAVSACIMSPIAIVILAGLSEEKLIQLTEDQASGIGVITLLLMVAAAVFTFITQGAKINKFEYLTKEVIDTEYGVTGMVKEKKAAFEAKSTRLTALAVIMCILGAVPIFIAACFDAPDYVSCILVGVLLAIVAVAVNIFVRVGSLNGSYNVLLQEGDFSEKEKVANQKHSAFTSCYWLLCTALFLLLGFTKPGWNLSWLVWPIGGVIFGAIMSVLKARDNK